MSEYSCSHHQALALALEASFVDENIHSDETMQAKLLTNDFEKNNKVLTTINKELVTCDNFMFSVAFITDGGITMLLNAFKILKEKGIKGRILTSTYQFFNTPKTFRTLLKHQEVVDVRIYNTKNFHAKGYVFKQSDISNFIIGSSNLTQNALTYNHEWNIKVNSAYQGALTKEIEREFDATWERSIDLTSEWIDSYEEEYNQSKIIDINKMLSIQKSIGLKLNKMQREALDALERIRNEGKNKAILISATGTGKTYLSAFDVMKVKPKKFLFVIHRENVARAAMESFKYVLGKDISMAILSGNHKLEETPADYIFATIQTLSKDRYLERFDPSYFDYIVIDEVHHASASTYTKILNHFKPKFMLGMSATPERTDGFNVVELFDYNIAYEIRLQDAMKYNLLAPFHYFGIQEIEIDGNVIDDKVEFNRLIHEERINHIISNLDYYGYSGNRPRGLIFCSRNEEASKLSAKFNERGFRTVALSGESSEESRRIAIDRLEQQDKEGGLDYIFTVDIFNEGIDIPKVNQVVMLRPTQSSIIFIQQLGRGLRKAELKDYVVILDFIGNYQNNYMIPIALSGDRSLNKDKLRRFAQEASSLIHGCSTVNFDKVTQKKIYESINQAKFSQVAIIKKEYQYLKQIVGRIPTLTDFYEHGAIDPMIINEKFESYHAYLKKYEPEYHIQLSIEQEMILKMLTKEISNSKRPHEILIIKMLLSNEVVSIDSINESLELQYGIKNDNHTIESAISLLSNGFLQNKHRERYNGCHFLEKEGNEIIRSEYFSKTLGNNEFENKLIDFIEFSKLKYEAEYFNRYDNTNLVLYQKYTRKDACRLLNWEKDESAVIFGYTIKNNTCPIFVTYNKNKSIIYSINYEDEFINRHQFSWMTRSGIKYNSKEPVAIRKQNKSALKIHLFIKKADDEGSEHYYLGKMNYLTMDETEIKDKNDSTKSLPIVNVRFAMDESVREDIYDYLINR